jgi:hypothetical protein
MDGPQQRADGVTQRGFHPTPPRALLDGRGPIIYGSSWNTAWSNPAAARAEAFPPLRQSRIAARNPGIVRDFHSCARLPSVYTRLLPVDPFGRGMTFQRLPQTPSAAGNGGWRQVRWAWLRRNPDGMVRSRKAAERAPPGYRDALWRTPGRRSGGLRAGSAKIKAEQIDRIEVVSK